jgi:nitronate monooxygenase
MLNIKTMYSEIGIIRQQTDKPVNVNFFVHQEPSQDLIKQKSWMASLSKYYSEFELNEIEQKTPNGRAPFSEDTCRFIEDVKPEVVSFHFGLPKKELMDRIKAIGCTIMSSATTVDEACWLEARGCDVIIAQGYEAGGHRAMFLSNDINTQIGSMALIPQISDAVTVPVIAAGGIADGRGVAAAFSLGASGVQVGTPYLLTKEALVSDLHRQALKNSQSDETALTNIFTGRPARGIVNRVMTEIGPITSKAPDFPLSGTALAPLKAAAEKKGLSDFSSLWSGQAASLAYETSSANFTKDLARDAMKRMGSLV